MQSDSKPPARARLSSRTAIEVLVACAIFLGGATMMFDSHRIGAGWADGTLEPGYFPLRIGAIICLASLAIVVRALFLERKAGAVFTHWSQLRLVLAVLVPTLVYLGAMVWLGTYLASALFIALFMRVSKASGYLKIAITSLSIAAVLFVMFEILFLVPLPKGPVEALLGY